MATNYYVRPEGSDSNDGSTHALAKQRLSAMIAVLEDPITDEVCINMEIGSYSSPNGYSETSGVVQLKNLRCSGPDASLTIRTYKFDDPNCTYFDMGSYFGNGDPYGLGSQWNPHAQKPIYLGYRLEIINFSGNINLEGLGMWKSGSPWPMKGLYVENSNDVHVMYCSFGFWAAGVHAARNSIVTFENSFAALCNMAVVGSEGSQIFMVGDNYLEDHVKFGLVCYNNTTAVFRSWPDNLGDHFTTEISTSNPRKRYAAIKALLNSSIIIEDPDLNPTQTTAARIKITNESLLETKEYYGVVLESKSSLIGAEHFTFSDPDINQGKETIPSDKQFKEDGKLTAFAD